MKYEGKAFFHNSFVIIHNCFIGWMVADGILDFKLALPRNKLEQEEFHDK